MNVLIRPVSIDDVEDLQKLKTMAGVFETTGNHKGERLDETFDWINSLKGNGYMFVAEIKTEVQKNVIGYVLLEEYKNPRYRHKANLRIAVDQRFQNRGVGKLLLSEIIDFADNWIGLKRLQLSVMSDNNLAISLYERFGFRKEGIKKEDIFFQGKYVDVVFMGRINTIQQTNIN